jgi:uncharacterized phage protein (TIGR01671 family)
MTQREIKFEAFLKEDKEIWPVSSIDFDREIVTLEGLESGDVPIRFRFDEIELREYTGLKDKNDKEIFWGDIIKSEYSHQLYKVVFCDKGHFAGSYCLKGLSDGKYSSFHQNNIWFPSDEPRNWDEIIGNVYESPELLTNNK